MLSETLQTLPNAHARPGGILEHYMLFPPIFEFIVYLSGFILYYYPNVVFYLFLYCAVILAMCFRIISFVVIFQMCQLIIVIIYHFPFRMSTEVQAVLKVDSLGGGTKRKKDAVKSENIPAVINKKHKTDESRHFKFSKKRSQSFTGGGKMFPPYKKRKKGNLIPPTKFLLGGNIRDPLNLNSLQDEEVNK